MVVQHFQEWNRGGRMGLWGSDSVEGKGRGRLPEGSALWLALSNWLMRKASLCSWQAGDSSSWLRWYTYLGLKCQWRSWREGLPSHCKGFKKEIRLLHIMPNEFGHMLQCHIRTHMLLGSIEHTPNRMSLLRDEPGREMREHRRLLSWQMMFHLRGFIVLQLPLRFIFLRNDPEVSPYHRMNRKKLETFLSCLCCWQMLHEISGTHWKFNAGKFMVQSVLEMNQAYSIYPKPNLSMSRPKKENKMYIFSDRQ